MSGLTRADFWGFFREVNEGNDPFPWQEQLAQEVIEKGQWRECLDLPTGSGKTAVLEIAVFHLALEAQKEWSERRAPVRIAMVVDRRLIVDQAEKRAKKIQNYLREAKGPVSAMVADSLKKLAGGDDPLVVRALRGGLPRESDWARTPVQPTVLLSTVDQVGSRMLFRGYGVSKSMRPVHAGLLGSDCLLFLDEAHLSEPFRQSLRSVERYRGTRSAGQDSKDQWTEVPPGPWGVVQLSATPGTMEGKESPFKLEAADEAHAELGSRLKASKPAELREVSSDGQAAAYATLAREARKAGLAKVLIVVNRVDLARAIFDQFEEGEARLLTGRVREIDRLRIVDELGELLDDPEDKNRAVYAVATQCVEAGADYDFDALVTQVAPLDALRQRFGRLNRRGREIVARAFIVASKEDLSPKKLDPVYGDRARKTWKKIEEIAKSEGKRKVIDFGTLRMRDEVSKLDVAELNTEKADAPVMMPAYVDLWTCTNPGPAVEPEVALFLHGPEKASADVQVVWRADIGPNDLENAERLQEILTLAPPRSAEVLAAPLWSVRRWLARGEGADQVSDTEGDQGSERENRWRGRPVFRWRGGDDPETRMVWPSEVRPGDVIVVPASYGGCDDWGWNGDSAKAVDDHGLQAAAQLKSSEVSLRLHPDLLGDAWENIRPLLERLSDEPVELREELARVLPEEWREELAEIRAKSAEIPFFYVDEDPSRGVILTGVRKKEKRKKASTEPSTESDRSTAEGDHALLKVHTEAVVRKAAEFGQRAGLADKVRKAVEFAAAMHDAGKGDRRFQAYLHNGIVEGELLAKSRLLLRGAADQQARKRAALPERWRHEALSVKIALEDDRLAAENADMDRELAVWLIGTHHGWGRPFFPHQDEADETARTVSGIDGKPISLPASPGPQYSDFEWEGRDWAQLSDLLHRRYGAWELARFEAVLRLADHRASEEGENADAYSAGTGA